MNKKILIPIILLITIPLSILAILFFKSSLTPKEPEPVIELTEDIKQAAKELAPKYPDLTEEEIANDLAKVLWTEEAPEPSDTVTVDDLDMAEVLEDPDPTDGIIPFKDSDGNEYELDITGIDIEPPEVDPDISIEELRKQALAEAEAFANSDAELIENVPEVILPKDIIVIPDTNQSEETAGQVLEGESDYEIDESDVTGFGGLPGGNYLDITGDPFDTIAPPSALGGA